MKTLTLAIAITVFFSSSLYAKNDHNGNTLANAGAKKVLPAPKAKKTLKKPKSLNQYPGVEWKPKDNLNKYPGVEWRPRGSLNKYPGVEW
jgi:hypothetical protein